MNPRMNGYSNLQGIKIKQLSSRRRREKRGRREREREEREEKKEAN